MSVSDKFQKFSSGIKISESVANDISYRYKRITRQLNTDFWDTTSEISHSLYAGSYGRNTAIHVSDIDMLFQLSYDDYVKYNGYITNGQSALLQDVRNSLRKTYSTSYIGGDGQVVKINFDDGINFEIVPCFENKDGSFTFPDSNGGGSWKITNPRPEIKAIRDADIEWNYNLKKLCRMARAWKDEWSVPMGGLLIDTLAYQFLRNWKHRNDSYVYYDWMTRDFFEFLKNQDLKKTYWLAPGSAQYVWRKGEFEHKALRCYNLAVSAVKYEADAMPYSANSKWKEIYGSKFKG
jgi:hypothetical protein